MIYVSNISHSLSRNEHKSCREGTDVKVHQIIGILPNVSVHRKGRTFKQPRCGLTKVSAGHHRGVSQCEDIEKNVSVAGTKH